MVEPALMIRRMEEKDIPQVSALDIASSALPWSERSLRFELDNKYSQSWVAEILGDGNTRLVGVLVLWIILDEAHIANLAVHPDFRRRHIGQKLLAHGLLAASEAGARYAYLEVRRENQAALALYHQFGFIEVGVRPHYYEDNHEDALLMTLENLGADVLLKWAE